MRIATQLISLNIAVWGSIAALWAYLPFDPRTNAFLIGFILGCLGMVGVVNIAANQYTGWVLRNAGKWSRR